MLVVFDIETDGLLDEATKLHVFSYSIRGQQPRSTKDPKEIQQILDKATTLVGHNIVCYDIPVLKKFGYKVSSRLIDTLPLSWYLYPNRLLHGLDSWGKFFGVPKPKVTDWSNLTYEEYEYRCEEDVKINVNLWNKVKSKLLDIYGSKDEADRMVEYLSFKMDVLREQEASGWVLDVDRAQRNFDELSKLQEDKVEELKAVMPTIPIKIKKTRPAKPFKKDGTWSVHGANWFNLLREHKLPFTYDGELEVIVGTKEPNPNSPAQVKDWLFSLGWVPITFNFERDDDGNERQIPQVRLEGELCESVIDLAEQQPVLRVLEGLTVIQHRLSIFKGYLESHKNGWLVASAGGLTNTLRFKHRKPLVNLPGVDKPWGKEVRGCLIAPKGKILCGSDMVSLEDTTKRHYMFEYDPEYVKEMSVPGFDPHLNLAVFAGVITQKEVDEYNAAIESVVKRLKPIRKSYKKTNYSAIYGVGPPKLARSLEIAVKEAKKLLKAYWDRNWSVRKLAEDTVVKNVHGEMWLYNPVSRFYYSLRYDKDRFSTLNQGTGVYCFDLWTMKFRAKRKQVTGQFHDEVCLCIKEGAEDKCTKLLKDAIKEVNDELNLNVKLDIDVQYGKTYADVH